MGKSLTNFTIRSRVNSGAFVNISSGAKNDNIQKANDEVIEKGLMYGDKVTFIKTGKEVADKLKAQNSNYALQINSLEKENKDLKKKIGSDPNEDYEHWDYIDESETLKDKVYSLTSDERAVMYNMDAYNGVSTESDIKTNNDIAKSKNKFNNNVRKICRLKVNINTNEVLIRNLKPSQKLKLSPIDLRDLHF